MPNLQGYFSDTTAIPSIGFQARDWYLLVMLMGGNEGEYEDIIYQLKVNQRVQNPPGGNTVINVTDVKLGQLLKLSFQLRSAWGKQVGKSHLGRVEAVLVGIQATYPQITAFFTDVAAHEQAQEDGYTLAAKKALRGKLPVI